MLRQIWKFLKASWEAIVFVLGFAVAYITLRPQNAPEPPQRDSGLDEREEEAKAKQREAEAKKSEAKKDLKRLKQQENKLTEALNRAPQHEDKTKKELRKFMRRNYGKKK